MFPLLWENSVILGYAVGILSANVSIPVVWKYSVVLGLANVYRCTGLNVSIPIFCRGALVSMFPFPYSAEVHWSQCFHSHIL